jgi:curved DNA-binding protein CbpA
MDNYYQMLGITRSAAAVEVKAAFQKKMKALESSPLHGEHRENQEKMLRRAFLTLFDPNHRAKYDRQVDAAAGPLVVLEEAEGKGLSVITITVAAVLLVGAVLGGWYVTHPSARKQEEARKVEDQRSRAARQRMENAPVNKNPNPFRDTPDSEKKDRMIKEMVERDAREMAKDKK